MSAPQSYYVPVDAGEAEFTEKRSRFLGHVRRVETEAEARAFLDEMRKKYYDARHNCWCYVLHEGGVVRYGDDGEPQGTAGQPMLNVFQREGVENVVCVVTRYFGGVLLGACFMATDYVTSPATPLGKLIFGCGCGLVTMLIRLHGAFPEGVSFAILILNAFTPLISRFTQPKPFGARR